MILSSADFDGINLIAIKALEKRTKELNNHILTLEEENADLKTRIEKLENFLKIRFVGK